MTVKDAIAIVKGNDNAGTEYLKKQTTEALKAEFKPVIQTSLDKVGATQHYGKIITAYNKIPGVQKLNPDLADYVTQKAIEGLFVMVQEEEAKIRKDPAARATELLKKVFGKN
jgi:two-component SAPR family response regulator